jgi:hypothetical protein
MDRYFLDIRCGCAAVRDRNHPSYDESYQGLHHDTPDVVEYKHGIRSNDTGGWTGWTMKDEDIKELQDLCDKLNVWPHREKVLNDLLK